MMHRKLNIITSYCREHKFALVYLLFVLCNSFSFVQNSNDKLSGEQLPAHIASKLSKKEAILNEIRQNNHKLIALVDQSVTLSCAIELDDKNFSKSENYKVIWSREIDNGRDYEPLALDDTRLVSNGRIDPHRLLISKQSNDRIEWSLVINALKLNDTSNYICQLNRKPYDVFWLKRFMLNVYEPAHFADQSEHRISGEQNDQEDENVFIKNVHEHEDFKLKCHAKGRPRPVVSWYLRYLNNTSIHLNIDDNEIIIKNIKRTSKIDRVECQASNGYGPTAIRSFKINIKHSPHIINKSKLYKLYNVESASIQNRDELKLNCTAVSNPVSSFSWHFLPIQFLPSFIVDHFMFSSNSRSHNLTHSSQEVLDDYMRLNSNWISLNNLATFTLNYASPSNDGYESNELRQLNRTTNHLSKYRIYEKSAATHHNVQNSLLVVKHLSEKDAGMYKCVAANQLGNSTIDYKIRVLVGNQSGEKTNGNRSLAKKRPKSNNKANSRTAINKNAASSNENTSHNEYSSEYLPLPPNDKPPLHLTNNQSSTCKSSTHHCKLVAYFSVFLSVFLFKVK